MDEYCVSRRPTTLFWFPTDSPSTKQCQTCHIQQRSKLSFYGGSEKDRFELISRRTLVGHFLLGTLRYTTARCYYGYFGRDGLGWYWCFIRQSQMIKILLYGNGMCSLYESLQKWILSRTPEIILLLHEIGLTNDIDFLLLYLSHISQNSDLSQKPQNKIETLI